MRVICGLAGVAGTLEKLAAGPDDHAVFSALLHVSVFRGSDSTGVAGRSFGMDKGEIDLVKMVVASPEFLDMGKARGLIAKSDQLMIGHTRSRTVGEINKKNAQPFDFEELVGTHNGTLSYTSKNRLEGGKVCSTDSEALWYRIDKDGFDAALKLTDDKDAMALVWYDKAKHRLNFYRNAHRPLFYCYSPDRTKIYWASETGMLYWVLNRTKTKFEKVRMLPETLHWSQPLPDKKGVAFPKPETRFCKQPKAYTPATTGGTTYYGTAAQSAQTFKINDKRACGSNGTGEADTCGVGNGGRTALLNSKPDDICTGKGVKMATVVDLSKFRLNRMIVRSAAQGGNHYKSDFSARSYDKARFEAKMNEGCCNCGSCPAWGEPVKFLRDDNVICASCLAEARAELAAGKLDGDVLAIVNTMS